MATRSRWARGAAAVGAACLLVAPLGGGAQAQTTPSVTQYESTGTGRGVGLRFSLTPSIFDPLLDLALLHGTGTINSAGNGQAQAIASLLFPGMLVVGGAGCAGVPGGLWVQGYYPPTGGCPQEQRATLNPDTSSNFQPAFDQVANEVLDRVTLNQGRVDASTDLGMARTETFVQDLALATTSNGEPVVTVGSVRIETAGTAMPDRVGHLVTVTLNDIELLGGALRIDSIISTAETSSDGTTGAARGAMTLGNVLVDDGSTARRATLDHDGVRIVDPDLSRRQRLDVERQLEASFAQAGVTVTLGSPVEIVDGGTAEANVGGLIIALHGRIPSVAVPDELAPVVGQIIEQIPTQCLGDFGAPLPLCFGAGALPGPGTAARATISLGAASAFTAGDSLEFDLGGDGSFDVPDTDFGSGPSGPATFGPGPGFDPGSDATPPSDTPETAAQPRGPLVGLVAKMPSGALLGAGLGLLVLALALAFGPSLRHAGSR